MRPNELKTGTPARQGFYKVRVTTGELVIAEWREHEKAAGKRWWTYASADPTVDKTRVPLDGVVGYAKVDDVEVERFLKRAPTREEKIEEAYRSYQSRNSLPKPVRRAVPENRRLTVGQEVQVGQLTEAVVAGLYEDGEVVVVEHGGDKLRNGGGVGPRTFGTWHWMAVLPKSAPKASGMAHTPSYSVQTYLSTPIGTLVRRVYSEGVQDNPEYQRGYAWTGDDKARFLDTLFAGRPMGNFIFVTHSDGRGDEVLDGKQRLSTLLELVMSVLPYRGVYWHEMSDADRNTVMQRPAQFADLSDKQYTEADFWDIFLDVNAAGVPQTEEHLNFARSRRDALRAAEAAGKQ
jgi:hypothetical protein